MENPYKYLLGNSFSVTINASDFFYYATAMSVEINDGDYSWVLETIKLFPESGLDACIAYIANLEPIKPHQSVEFLKAILHLQTLSPRVFSDENGMSQIDGIYRTVKE